MIARQALTCIDHNANLGRSQVEITMILNLYLKTFIPLQALTQAGVPRVKTECDRGGQTWHAREVKIPKCTEWMDIIGRTVIKVLIVF